MSTEIVVSACNDSKTINEIKNMIKDQDIKLTVYEKCGSNEYDNELLSNVGREQHTFAHHFSKNYEGLCDYTICVPGNWDKHPDRRTFLKESLENKSSFSCWPYEYSLTEQSKLEMTPELMGKELYRATPLGMKNWSDHHLGKEDSYDTTLACNQGMMMVSSSNVKKNRQSYYTNIEYELGKHNDPEAGHYMERLMKLAYT